MKSWGASIWRRSQWTHCPAKHGSTANRSSLHACVIAASPSLLWRRQCYNALPMQPAEKNRLALQGPAPAALADMKRFCMRHYRCYRCSLWYVWAWREKADVCGWSQQKGSHRESVISASRLRLFRNRSTYWGFDIQLVAITNVASVPDRKGWTEECYIWYKK